MGLFGVRTEVKTRIAHAVVGANILIEAFEKFEEHEAEPAITLAVLGLAMLVLAKFHNRLHRTPAARHFEAGAFFVEATVLAIRAADYFHKGKHALPWCYVAAALCYTSLAVWRYFHPDGREHA